MPSSCQGSDRPRPARAEVRAAAMPSASSTRPPVVSSARPSSRATISQMTAGFQSMGRSVGSGQRGVRSRAMVGQALPGPVQECIPEGTRFRAHGPCLPDTGRAPPVSGAPFPSSAIDKEASMTLLTWIGILLCLSQSAMFSGLNLAYFSINKLELEIEARRGNPRARRVRALRRDANFLLVTILWGNVAVNVLLALLRSEEHTSELQSRPHLVCRLLLEKKKKKIINDTI